MQLDNPLATAGVQLASCWQRALWFGAASALTACSQASPATSNADAVQTSFGDSGKANPTAADATGNATDAAANASDIAATVCVAAGKGECDTAAECGSGQYCDPCLRKCAAERELCEPCTADIQCKLAVVDGKPGSACLAYATGGNFCGRACLSNAGCPATHTCEALPGIAAMQCVPKSKSCGTGGGGCKDDTECPFQSVCSADFGVCIKGCDSDTACASGKLCSLGHCSDPCTGDGDCTKLAAEAKCVDKKCTIPGGCLAAEQCTAPETHCDAKTHKCAPGCVADQDCKDFGKKCASGKCVAKGCEKNWECPYFHVCDTATGQCKKAEGLYCAKCDPQDQDAKACGGKPNACFKFQDAQGQDKGAFCGITCSADAGGPCPQGWACQEIKDDKGASQGKLCMRPCYTTPVPAGGAPP